MGHITRHERWKLRTIQWRPRETKRNIDRPPLRWLDDEMWTAGKN